MEKMRVILCVKTCKVKVVFNANLQFNQMCSIYYIVALQQQRRYKLLNDFFFFALFSIFFLQPGDSGFVLLGDLTVETSTDPEPDDTWICNPPSPCDVQFKNANVVINGKSSLRDKSKSDSKVNNNKKKGKQTIHIYTYMISN